MTTSLLAPSGEPISAQSIPSWMALGRGTESYTAPEIYEPHATYSFSSDVYSLAVSLFMIGFGQGKQPFQIGSTALRPSMSGVQLIVAIKRGFWEWVEAEFDDKYTFDGIHSRQCCFPNGELVDNRIMELLKETTNVNPKNRPSAKVFLERLLALE